MEGISMIKIAITTLLCLFIIGAGIVHSFAEDSIKQSASIQNTFSDTLKQFLGKKMKEVCVVGAYCLDGTVKEVNGSCLILGNKSKRYYINIDQIIYFAIYQ